MTTKRTKPLNRVRGVRTKVEPVEPARGGDDQCISRAVAKALEILEVLQNGNGPMPLNEVAARIRLSKTCACRLLRTWEVAGSLTAGELGKYALFERL